MARGYGHRKLYPYTTKKQRQLAPAMPEFINKNRSELTHQGNTKLKSPGEMIRDQARGTLRGKWSRTQNKGTSAKKISGYIESNGGSRGRAKKILTSAHAVSFGADPKNR